MGIGSKSGPFYRLPNEKFIYKWSPSTYDPKSKIKGISNKKVLCTATP